MAFKEDFKDEIPEGGKRLYGLVDKNGAYIDRDIQIVRTNENTQEGDAFSALEANAIFKALNDNGRFHEELQKDGGSIDVNRARKLKSSTSNYDITFGEAKGAVVVRIDGTPFMMENTKYWDGKIGILDAKIVNPSGNDFITWAVPFGLNFKNNNIYVFAINANYGTSNVFVTGIAFRPMNNDFVVKLDHPMSGTLHITLMIITDSNNIV